MIHLTEPNGSKHRVHHSAIVHIAEPGQHVAAGINAQVGMSNGVQLSVTETADQIEAEKDRQRAIENVGVDYQTKD